MWKILQQKKPDDFVIATGKQYSVRDFVNIAANKLDIKLIWKGKGIAEKGIDKKTGKTIIEVSKKYFRPTEVESLKGDFRKAKKILNWHPLKTFKNLVDEMVIEDFNYQKRLLNK